MLCKRCECARREGDCHKLVEVNAKSVPLLLLLLLLFAGRVVRASPPIVDRRLMRAIALEKAILGSMEILGLLG